MLTCLITVAAIRLKYDVLQYVFFLIFYIIKTAVTWLKYCRYGVKQYSINQSMNQSISRSITIKINISCVIKLKLCMQKILANK